MCGPIEYAALIMGLERIILLAATAGTAIWISKSGDILRSAVEGWMRKTLQYITEAIQSGLELRT